MTGTSSFFFNSLKKSKPFPSGSVISNNIRSIFEISLFFVSLALFISNPLSWFIMLFSASVIVLAVITLNPSCSNEYYSPIIIASLSSTDKIVFIFSPFYLFKLFWIFFIKSIFTCSIITSFFLCFNWNFIKFLIIVNCFLDVTLNIFNFYKLLFGSVTQKHILFPNYYNFFLIIIDNLEQ